MPYRVFFNNPGGELDCRVATTPEQAASAAIELIESAGELHDGDEIKVEEIE